MKTKAPATTADAVPITAVHRAIFLSVLRRAEAQQPPGIRRNRCALDTLCGAAIALQAAGDTRGALSLTNASFLVSVRGCDALRELTKGS